MKKPLIAAMLVGTLAHGGLALADQSTGDKAEKVVQEAAAEASDAWITTKVKAQLIEDKEIKASKIDVTTRGGVVTLDGSVVSAEAKGRALSIARGTRGVKQVVDHLKISPAT